MVYVVNREKARSGNEPTLHVDGETVEAVCQHPVHVVSCSFLYRLYAATRSRPHEHEHRNDKRAKYYQ
jgi:hypothetical protein